jgi:multiple sugar transport system ATP-binding protein
MGNIVLEGIDKVYENGFQAVHQLSLEVHDGEFLVLVGPSGCGKSTALRMIAGLESITSGTLHIGGREVQNLEPKDRDIAMVFQSYALYPHLTVRDNIAFALKLRKMPKDEIARRVDDAARVLELTEYLDTRPGRLSGGQRQRVAMGRAIVRQPQAFLMDEPLSNLDAKLRVQMRAEISRLQRSLKTTTVYVTHDQIEAMTMGDRVAVLSRGVLQQVDTPQALYDMPANIFVATFIGSPQMNVVRAGFTNGSDGPALTIGSQRIALSPATMAARPSLASYDGRNIAVGLRPEHLSEDTSSGATNLLSGSVTVREGLGSEVLLHIEVAADQVTAEDVGKELAGSGNATIIARVAPSTPLKPGDNATLAVKSDELHMFDLTTGLAIRD